MTREEREDAINYFKNKLENEVYGTKYNKLAIEALEPTTKIEESNFSQEQYKADLQSAYDCGVASVKQEQRKGDVETLTKYFLGLVEVLRLHGIIHYSEMELITGEPYTLKHNPKKVESEE